MNVQIKAINRTYQKTCYNKNVRLSNHAIHPMSATLNMCGSYLLQEYIISTFYISKLELSLNVINTPAILL